MKKEQSTPKYKVGEYATYGNMRIKILAYVPNGEYIIELPSHGVIQVQESTIRPCPELKYQEGEEVYYKDGTVQVISAVGNPGDPCPYHISIKVPEKDLRPRDIPLKEFKSKFCNALKYYGVKDILELVVLYPDRAREYYETLV